jgi:ribosomal protein RSM22 (predicted rRNA methylase)
MELTADLAAALEAVLAGAPGTGLQAAAGRLSSAYRSGELPGDVLDTPAAARAYAAYRMPATAAAVRAALLAAGLDTQLPATTRPGPPATDPGDPAPAEGTARAGGARAVGAGSGGRTLVDVGGGTGAALWAVAATVPGIATATVLDRSPDALALGRELAARSPSELVRRATWTRGPVAGPAADLVTMAYVLAELPERAREDLVRSTDADTVVVVEPGTPAGHGRVLAARDVLVGRGYRVLAPCPHDRTCPLAAGDDWCHFSVRVPRSARHRRAKGATVGWEDEKFSYVVATRGAGTPAPGRIVRHPYLRKGLVEMPVCAPAGIEQVRVSKKQGPLYRAARDAGWGDPWPPPHHPPLGPPAGADPPTDR